LLAGGNPVSFVETDGHMVRMDDGGGGSSSPRPRRRYVFRGGTDAASGYGMSRASSGRWCGALVVRVHQRPAAARLVPDSDEPAARRQRALGDDVYVPGLHFVEREAGSVERLLVWTDGMASAMPRCELVFVQRTEGEEVVAAGIVPGAEAIAALRSLLVWERDGEVEVPVVPPDAEAAAQPVVDALIERATIEPGEVVPLSVEELADAGRPV
jgi:hypothetical protein